MTVGNASAPFLDFKSFITEEAETQEPEVQTTLAVRSPFMSVYESAEGESAFDDPVREAYSTLVNELYDEEFDEALFELLTDARNMHQDHLASGYSSSEADRIVTQHFSQLARESEAMVDAIAREFGSRNGTGIVESEIESFFEQYSPSAQIDPAFENFFGKLIKKVGKAVKTVAKGIAKIGLGPILNKIKALIKPLLNQGPAESDRKTSGSRSTGSPETGGEVGVCCAETGGSGDRRRLATQQAPAAMRHTSGKCGSAGAGCRRQRP